jgi:hypothetical protein
MQSRDSRYSTYALLMAGPFAYRLSQPYDVEPMLPLLSYGIGSDALTRGDEIESQRDAWIMSARCFQEPGKGGLKMVPVVLMMLRWNKSCGSLTLLCSVAR